MTESDPFALSDEEDGRERVLLVDVNEKIHAIPVTSVREVLRARVVTRVPQAPAIVRGLVNVRGMVVTVLELSAALGVSRATSARTDSPGSIVLLEHGGRLVGLAVDAVRDVRPLDDIAMVAGAMAAGQTAAAEGVVQGLASAGGDVVILLDVVALLARHLISTEEMGR